MDYYTYVADHQSSGTINQYLPYPDLALGQTPTHEQLVDMLASLGAATLHFYCVLYSVKGRDSETMSGAAAQALSEMTGASTFLPAMRHVLRAALQSGGGSSHTSVDQAVSEASLMLPGALLEVIRGQRGECVSAPGASYITSCHDGCTCLVVSRSRVKSTAGNFSIG
jgi:hypothetical protein